MSNDPPTTEEMLAALAKAGKNVSKTASEEDIEIAWIELQEEADKSEKAKASKKPEAKKAPADIEAALAAGDPLKGDKDPEFIAWARENLSPEEFAARYDGRKIPSA